MKVVAIFLSMLLGQSCLGNTEFSRLSSEERLSEELLEVIRNEFDALPDLPTRSKIDEVVINEDSGLVKFEFKNNTISMFPRKFKNKELDNRVNSYYRIFSDIIQRKRLPDFKFIMGMHDYGPVKHSVVTVCRAKDLEYSATITLPLEKFVYQANSLIRTAKHLSRRYPWDEKINKLFWRGALTGDIFNENNFYNNSRFKACLASLLMPDILDVKLTNFPQSTDKMVQRLKSQYPGMIGSRVKLDEYFKYKYILAIDGNTGPSLLYWVLFSNCVTFRTDSKWRYNFESALKPYVHYIPVKPDFSDIEEKYQWAENNPEKCLEIVKNANEFAEKNLKPEHSYAYIEEVLTQYSKMYSNE